MNLASRLREVVRPQSASGASNSGSPGEPQGFALRTPVSDPADILGGEWHEANGQRFLVVERTYSPGHRHGRVSVADALPPAEGWPSLSMLGGREPGRSLLYLDLETTGLAGGAGTYAFLVGCAWFDGGVFRIRQLFLSSFGAERVLLETLRELAGSASTLVTYNGKTFDVPLIDTRFLLHRMPPPFGELPHVDLLHPARRLWRSDDDGTQGSCRLIALEQGLLGFDREGDVPGFEIPSRYFHFVRSGDARPLEAVLEHNRLDLLALAMMTARAMRLLDEGALAASSAREALGLGRLFERAGRSADARDCFGRATELGGDALTQAEALRALAVSCRRERRFEDAAAAWRRLLDLRRCPPRFAREATEALAIHHEHRVRDLPQAYALAAKLMDPHRLARLNRKMGNPAADPGGGLFVQA